MIIATSILFLLLSASTATALISPIDDPNLEGEIAQGGVRSNPIVLDQSLFPRLEPSTVSKCKDSRYGLYVFAKEHIALVGLPVDRNSACPPVVYHDTPSGKIRAELSKEAMHRFSAALAFIGKASFEQLNNAYDAVEGINWKNFGIINRELCMAMALKMVKELGMTIQPHVVNFVIAELAHSPMWMLQVRMTKGIDSILREGRTLDSSTNLQLMKDVAAHVSKGLFPPTPLGI